MSGELTAKVRVVRCPKCRQLLPELPGFDVYKCGGCGTSLQAKKRKGDSVNSEVNTCVAVAAHTNGLDVVLKDDVLGNSTETLGDQNKSIQLIDDNIGDAPLSHEKLKDVNGKKNLSGCISERNQHSGNGRSDELSLGDKEGSSTSMHANSGLPVNDLKSKLAAGIDSSWCSLSAGEEEGLPSTGTDERNHAVVEKSLWASNENDSPGSSTEENYVTVARNGSCNSAVRPVRDSVSSSILLSSPDEQLQQTNSNFNTTLEFLVPLGDPTAQCSHMDDASLFSSDEIEDKSNNNSPSRVRGLKLQSDNCGNNYIQKRLSSESNVAANDSISYTLACRPAEESVSSSTLVTSNINIFDSVSSTDTDGTKENVITTSCDLIGTPRQVTNSSAIRGCQGNDGSKLFSKPMKGTPCSSVLSSSEQLHQVQHRSYVRSIETCNEMTKSPGARSLHAYDGSISYDEIEGQFLNQHSTPFDKIYDDKRVFVSEGRPTRNGIPVIRKTHEGLSIQESGDSSSDLSYKKSSAAKPIKQDRTELLEIMDVMCDNPIYNRRTERDEYHSRISQFPRPSRAGFDSGSLSDQFYNDYHYSSCFGSPDLHENPDLEKMKLLEMIYDLQDQLQRTPRFNRKTNGAVSARNISSEVCSAYNNIEADERVFRYGSNWRQNHNLSWIPFSGEESTSRQPNEHSCGYYNAQDWRYSGDLPPTVYRQKNGFSKSHLNHNCCTPNNPFPSSPHRWVSGTQSDDEGHRVHEVKKYLEKQTRVKRHYRPIAGGAPFITCYNCSELLHLPEDFLLFRRRCHRLKCSSCSKVLKYSIQDRIHIVSYSPAELDPTPSLVEMATSMCHPISTLHFNRSRNSDNVSLSDDYGQSVYRSNSSRDPASLSTLHRLHNHVFDRTSSHGSNMLAKRREEVLLTQTLNRYKTPADTDELARPSSSQMKPETSSPDIEEQPPARSSPLHRLMGYYSPSQVLRGSAASVEGTSSFNGNDKPLKHKRIQKLTKA